MPVSEDEFERPMQVGANQTTMSKAEQRKSNKPIMEKRRRARINHCLNELKTLILDAMKKDPARHSKLEKADILEMTVKHLQQIQRQQLATAVATDPGVIMRFKSGFDECAAEVSRYIGRLEGVDSGVKQRLTAHLHRCVSSLQQISPFPHQNMFSALSQNCDKSSIVLPNVPSMPGDVNNNSNQNAERIQIPSGLQLIPSRLPTGELALLVPNSNHISTFINAPTGTTFQFPTNTTVSISSILSPTVGGGIGSKANHTSAFTAVSKNQEYPSPTSTADIVKMEANLSDKEDFKISSFSSRLPESLYLQNYNFNVTEKKDRRDTINEDQEFKTSSSISTSYDMIDSKPNCGKYKTFENKIIEGIPYEKKITQGASSSSFQRNIADSTTSFIQPKEEETTENGFKPFQVDLPNTHLKAHISISENLEDVKPPPLHVHHKPNPNFTINPNKLYQKSPHKFVRNYPNGESTLTDLGKNEVSLEKFTKLEPLSISTKTEEFNDSNKMMGLRCPMTLVRSSQSLESLTGKIAENTYHKSMKRPLSNSSPEMSSPSSSEPFAKTPRISLNVTLTDDQSKDEQNVGNRCKRISVIVEDSSKSSVKDNTGEVTMNVTSQKDMWRPW